MQARQSQIDKVIEQQQATAIILERVTGRLDSLEHWRDEQDGRREREEERRDGREDKRPDQRRADLAIIISAASAAMTLLTLLVGAIAVIAQHWH